MSDERATIVLTCSVRHTYAGGVSSGRSRGEDTFYLPALPGRSLELLVDESLGPTVGARVEEDDAVVVVSWWFAAGCPVNYALVVHAAGGALDLDRFIEIDSGTGREKELLFPRWRFRSVW